MKESMRGCRKYLKRKKFPSAHIFLQVGNCRRRFLLTQFPDSFPVFLEKQNRSSHPAYRAQRYIRVPKFLLGGERNTESQKYCYQGIVRKLKLGRRLVAGDLYKL